MIRKWLCYLGIHANVMIGAVKHSCFSRDYWEVTEQCTRCKTITKNCKER
jgi:hypothetical protein